MHWHTFALVCKTLGFAYVSCCIYYLKWRVNIFTQNLAMQLFYTDYYTSCHSNWCMVISFNLFSKNKNSHVFWNIFKGDFLIWLRWIQYINYEGEICVIPFYAKHTVPMHLFLSHKFPHVDGNLNFIAIRFALLTIKIGKRDVVIPSEYMVCR